jgi:hypothetical protein
MYSRQKITLEDDNKIMTGGTTPLPKPTHKKETSSYQDN